MAVLTKKYSFDYKYVNTASSHLLLENRLRKYSSTTMIRSFTSANFILVLTKLTNSWKENPSTCHKK